MYIKYVCHTKVSMCINSINRNSE